MCNHPLDLKSWTWSNSSIRKCPFYLSALIINVPFMIGFFLEETFSKPHRHPWKFFRYFEMMNLLGHGLTLNKQVEPEVKTNKYYIHVKIIFRTDRCFLMGSYSFIFICKRKTCRWKDIHFDFIPKVVSIKSSVHFLCCNK